MGRVFTGTQAKDNEIGSLVDEIGGLDKAISITKDMLGLRNDEEINIIEYPMPQTKAEMIKMQLDQVRTFKAKDIIMNNDPEGYMALIETILSDQNQAILPVIINID